MTLHLNQLNYTLYGPRFCHIENRTRLNLVGNVSTGHGQPSTHCLHKNDSSVAFGFFNMTYLLIKNLQFFGCGAAITSQAVRTFNDTHPYLGMRQKAGLVFNHCQNLSITNVNITGGYYGYGIMLLNTMGGILDDVNLDDGIVQNCTTDIGFSCAGSGLMVVFKDTAMTIKESYDYSKVCFTNTNPESKTIVKQNINYIPRIPSLHYTKNDEACSLPIIGAAGITVIFVQSYYANFTVHRVLIKNFNYGSVAGGMLVMFLNGMKNSYIHVSDSEFVENGNLPLNPRQDGGSGLSIHSFRCNKFPVQIDLSYTHFHPIYINHVYFKRNGNSWQDHNVPSSKNDIKYGGAMYINIHDTCEDNYVIYIIMSTFRESYANSAGSGVYAILNDKVKKSKLSLTLDNCTSHNNKGTTYNFLYSTIASMTFVNWNNVTITGNSFFTNNWSPAITAYNSNLNLKGTILFQDNVGSYGAAISLLQSSYLILHEHLNVTFINNEVLLYGGAIYSDGGDVPGNTICAIQIYSNKTVHRELDINMTFIDNKAGLAGNSIYANPLYNCSQYYSLNIPENVNITNLLNIAFESSVTVNNKLKQMSSQPVNICSCKPSNNTSNSPIINCAVSSSFKRTIHTYPGKSILLYLAAVDGSHRIVYSPAVGFVSSNVIMNTHSTNTTLSLKSGQSLKALSGSKCTLIMYNILNTIDKRTHGLFTIATPGSPPTWFADVDVDRCPKGFMIKNRICTCNQFVSNIIDNVHCNITATSITRPIGSWFGDISFRNTTGLGYATVCPQGNCKDTTTSFDMTELEYIVKLEFFVDNVKLI